MADNVECKLDHFGIRVSNLEISAKFYERNFGFQKVREVDKPDLQLRLATLQLGDSYLELLQLYTTKTERQRIRGESLTEILKRAPAHIAIGVNSLRNTYMILARNDVELTTPFDFSKSKNIFCYDPDGFLIEIKQR